MKGLLLICLCYFTEEVMEKQKTKVEVISTHALGSLHVDHLDYRSVLLAWSGFWSCL